MSRFIVIEGIDGAGTTTQLSKLLRWLGDRGIDAIGTREPTDRSVGRVIRNTLQKKPGAPSKDCLPWLFAADRADHRHSFINPKLNDGTWVISDRYYHSSLAYQSLDLPFDEVLALNSSFPTPDLTLFCKLDFQTALSRIELRAGHREIFETGVILNKVARQYTVVMDRLRKRGDVIIDIDANQDVEAVFADIQDAVRMHVY